MKAFLISIILLSSIVSEVYSQTKYSFCIDLKYEAPLSIGTSFYLENEVNSYGISLYKGIDDVSFIFPYVSIPTHNLFIYQNERVDIFYRKNNNKLNTSWGISYLRGNQEMFDTNVYSVFLGIDYQIWERIYFSHSIYPGFFQNRGELKDKGGSLFINFLCVNFRIIK
jgi:hypothetical protein